SMTDPVETFMDRIPGSVDYALRPVREWMGDHVDSYVQRLRRGKELVDGNRIRVRLPEVAAEGDCEWSDGQVSFRDKITLVFTPAEDTAKVYVTEGTADPTDAKSSRTVLN